MLPLRPRHRRSWRPPIDGGGAGSPHLAGGPPCAPASARTPAPRLLRHQGVLSAGDPEDVEAAAVDVALVGELDRAAEDRVGDVGGLELVDHALAVEVAGLAGLVHGGE